MHPFFQEFYMDEERLFPLYEALVETGLLLLLHTGYDFAFERIKRAEPLRILKVLGQFPQLKLITSHMGASEDWDDARTYLIGKPIYTDISLSIQSMPYEQARAFILDHPREYILFGTDSPWADQQETIAHLLSLNLGPEWYQSIFWENANRLLGLDS